MYRVWASMPHPTQRMTRICIRARCGIENALYRLRSPGLARFVLDGGASGVHNPSSWQWRPFFT